MMDYWETSFYVLSYAGGPLWLALFLRPESKLLMRVFDVALIILTFHFAIITIPSVPKLLPLIASPEFGSLRSFLDTDQGFVGSWNHMIIGDLWIARWVVFDAIKSNVVGWVRFPFVLIIMLFGPLGLGFYFLFRIFYLKRLFLLEE